jgi:hypothetical protein
LISPQEGSQTDITIFNPTWTSRRGADVFQLEISTDRTFSNPSRIVRRQILSTSPVVESPQNLPNPIDLTREAELLADPVFFNFVSDPVNNPSPTLYWRVGARHDEDYPGPVHWISRSATDGDRTFRFVYQRAFQFKPSPLPPPPPGRAAALALNASRNRSRAAGLPLPLPGDVAGRRATTKTGVPSLQDILTARGRRRF